MKNNMKNKWVLAGAVAAFVAFSATVQAIPIVGTINFYNGSLSYTANSVTFLSASTVSTSPGLAPTGAYAGTGGAAPVTFNSITSFTPLIPNPVSPLWTFMLGGVTYSFNLTSLTVVTDNASFLSLSGFGTANITGGSTSYTASPGTWTLTSTGSGPTVFGFVAGDSVPDGGTTAILLGAALSGLALLRRKLTVTA